MRPSRPVRSRRERSLEPGLLPEKPKNRFQVLYLVVTVLVICSMLAIAVTTIDFGSLFGDDGDDDFVDPNADLIADQQTVVARNPDDVDEIVLLANMLGQTGRIQEAIPWYEKALALSPDDSGIRLDFARSLSGSGLQTDAEAQFNQVLKAEPDNQSAHYYLAELYMAWSPPRTDEAYAHYKRAAEIDPDSFLGERAQTRVETMSVATPDATALAGPE
ncbi:MAG TPA: tetratricopeptide repeat protein [Thermomicrobiales bacterium]|nr:tetratricopeptide repeat protein [Thermomicrobiales bacterium]